jgi:radical SAM protein (TIGR04043 family)
MVPVYNHVSKKSNYQLSEKPQGQFILQNGEDSNIKEISTTKEPIFYSLKTKDGIPYRSIALLHSKDVLATTILQKCIRFRDREESCQFCAIEQSLENEQTIIRKTPDQIAEVAEAAVRLDGIKQLVMTTGTPNSSDRGARIMAETARAVKAKVNIPIQGQCEPPDNPIWFQKMKDSGIDSLGMHLEVVEEEVRKKILPGKSEITLERYYEAFEESVSIFGKGEVSTYLLAGLGDSKESLINCSKKLISIGVYPFIVPFVPIAGTPLEHHPSPSTDFMIDIYRAVSNLLNEGNIKSDEMSAGCAKCGACSALSLFES